ncbi:hypothetical protein Slin15195_G035410 [Septoria linicola]|uniref:Uncharacterized protein n=1 Tax=Septoria linicola TaxID=215465 RepID=A0A9Q9EHR2_9PEZI|nr:hypothetical protein Slin14017_G116770 [Septoria linicola]USW50222.1 hypothetical protein Slin15195_G035410 [Septoria linicola]
MAHETQYVTSANGQRVRVASATPQHPLPPAPRPPPGSREHYHTHAPAPPVHMIPPAQHYRSHYDRAADRYARAQAMSGNYFSRKPVRASSSRREPPPSQLIDLPSSPPLQTVRVVPSATSEVSLLDYDNHEHPATQNNTTPQLFQSTYRFSGYPTEPTHRFQLFPTPVYPPRSFAFELEPVVKDKLAQFHYAILKDEEEEDDQVTFRPRPGSYRDISTAELAIAYSEASTVRPVTQEKAQDWEVKEQRAQVFRFEKPVPYHFQQLELFVDAQETIEGEGQEQEVSRYLDAVEEQVEDGMEWRDQQDAQVASDVDMSDGLPGDSSYQCEHHGEGRTSAGDKVARNMVEVKSPGKVIEAARMRGYRG